MRLFLPFQLSQRRLSLSDILPAQLRYLVKGEGEIRIHLFPLIDKFILVSYSASCLYDFVT
jgi:hypothetical protein